MTYTVIVADDEKLSLSLISSLIGDDSELDLVGACKDGHEAATLIAASKPDIAFLDIQMPGLSGLDIANQLKGSQRPHIIFVTAHEKYALRSFELHVLDYLIKPLERARFRHSVARAKEIVDQDRTNMITTRIAALVDQYGDQKQTPAPRKKSCIVTRSGERLNWLEITDIVWLEASNQYLTIHTAEDSHVISQSLASFLDDYRDWAFLQVHRSSAVNLKHVAQVNKKPNGRVEVRLSNGAAVSISRSRKYTVETLLKKSRENRLSGLVVGANSEKLN